VSIKDEPVEVEVKFQVMDIGGLRRQIAASGAVCRGRVFETNLRLDNADGILSGGAALLRLRQDNRTTLTFKSKPPVADAEFKVHNEYEVEVNDFEMMKRILKKIGFTPQQTYEKWRETFILDGTCLCIDSMPFGDFLEIEGSPTGIKNVASRLGLVWQQRILMNYLQIFGIIKEHFNLPFRDVTFENFATVSLNFGPLIEKMRVKRPV
jgi:adenylate cyclase class 2